VPALEIEITTRVSLVAFLLLSSNQWMGDTHSVGTDFLGMEASIKISGSPTVSWDVG